MTNFDIKIVSDTVCPWCYVGKKRLEKGIELYKAAHPDSNDTFSTTWYPFYLVPDAPKQGIDKQQYYLSKFGAGRTQMMFQRLAQLGQSDGIAFKFGGRTGNTRDSHRLIQLGKTKSPAVQTRVIEELFAAYFENEKDITSHETLLEAGTKAGLDAAEVKAWLESGKGGPEVDREVQDAYEHSISGVPNFTIQDRFEIGGAQEPSAFVQLFERIKKQDGGSLKSQSGETC
ncbi:thioredoxin-like protein [Mytilinidion resinicola]|uniref:Thioredoxin-like protein n=1 Tax=Mytilinidion resinicola TaxID=574789 RepID=A0A6A6YG92_9PEZI|nr:thioredoxin-like protein [Mytilinidion resinicola]KAF2807821.1 thioredoxin-like protein [Mytilinidion resinicola]